MEALRTELRRAELPRAETRRAEPRPTSETSNGSIYERVLGDDFQRLHPRIQERFGFDSRAGIGQVGRGVMEKIWRGPAYTLPFLYLGTWRNIMFPESGRNVPFRVENFAYPDDFGRETVTWVRTFDHPTRSRRFDATMIYSESRRRIVDYLGSHQHLAVDLDLSVSERGGMKIRSGEQRFYEGLLGFRFPLALSGIACVEEWFDEDVDGYRIEVDVRNPLLGKLFGYVGRFQVETVEVCREAIPNHVKPLREESRE